MFSPAVTCNPIEQRLQSGKDEGDYTTSRGVNNLAYSSPSHHRLCSAVYCLCLVTSGIVFSPSTGSITDHSQSAKDIDPYLKSQLYVEDPDMQAGTHFTK